MKLKSTDMISLTYTLQVENCYDIALEDLASNFGYELGVESVEDLLKKYPTSEKLAEAIELNLSVKNLEGYECYSEVMEESLDSHDVEDFSDIQ